MKNFLRLFILALSAALSGQAVGQAVSKYPTITVAPPTVGSIVTGQASLTVGAASANVALGSAGPTVDVYNPGTLVVYVKLGVGSGTTAATTDYPVAPGSHTILNTDGTATYIAAIAPSGTPTLTIATGAGSPLGWGGGGSGATTWGGGILGAMANYGTSPGAVLVPGVNAFITNPVGVTGTFWQATQPISAAALPLPTGAATSANQGTMSTWAAGTLGAMANYGTSPGAVLVPGVNAYVTSIPALVAGSAIIGKTGIDQTTPGTTNGVTVLGQGFAASGKTAVASTFTSATSSASFTPLAGRQFNVSLWGTFASTIQLERSFDSGTTWLPITAAGTPLFVWTAPASETSQEDEVGVIYRLHDTAYTSGTVNYRISQ